MIYKNLLYTGMLFVVLPVWFGLLWVWYLKIEGTVRKLCNAWVLGLASMFASGQILLVPMILGKRTLTEAVTLWKIFLVIVSIVIMVILIRRCGFRIITSILIITIHVIFRKKFLGLCMIRF